jgi:hypothetical protein
LLIHLVKAILINTVNVQHSDDDALVSHSRICWSSALRKTTRPCYQLVLLLGPIAVVGAGLQDELAMRFREGGERYDEGDHQL